MNPFDPAVGEAAARLRAGGVALFPTETFYAIGADPRSAAGVAGVFRLKRRPRDLRLPWIAADREQVESRCRLSRKARELADRHWPGPVSLVLPLRGAETETVAVRVSSHPLARALAAALGHPVISTSANRSGAPPATTANRALGALGAPESVFVLDGGSTPGGAPSAIVDCAADPPRLLRGALPDG